jgi:hypothetical protein
MAPGVSSSGSGSMGFGAAGQRQYQNSLRGRRDQRSSSRHRAESVPQDWVQEFQTSKGYSAEFGRATGGVLNVITRSGSSIFRVALRFIAARSRQGRR